MQRHVMCKFVPFLNKAICFAALVLAMIIPTFKTLGDELYLLSGTPWPNGQLKLGSTLYRLKSTGATLEEVRGVVSNDAGLDFVEADYGHRLIVLGYPPLYPSTFVVLNMDAPAKVLSVNIQGEPNSVVASHHLLNIPGQGIVQALRIGDSPVDAQGRPINVTRPDRLVGVSLAGASKKQEDISWNDMPYVQ
ncbi:MAG: hypothetical protein ACHQWV_04510, partial [Nitrospirales bacterium]